MTRLPFRRPTSTPASSRLFTPHSIRSATDLLTVWAPISMTVERLILTRPTVAREIVETFANMLNQIDRETQMRAGDPT